jgi:hypothetical protein
VNRDPAHRSEASPDLSNVPHFQTLLALLAFIAVWCLGRSFPGIAGDALIYIGRGLADLDPNGLGRDLMFADEGQSKFSVFTFLVRLLIGLYGPARADLILVVIAQALWLAALIGFVMGLAPGRPRLAFATLICAAVLPGFYGPYERFHFAESIAVPRPFAEALVLFALTALIWRRDILATFLVLLAACFHPIMALAGLGTLVVIKGLEDWRWLAAATCVTAVIVCCGWLGFPLADRLFILLDPEWRAVNLARNPLLFPSEWAGADFAAISVHAATIGIAVHLTRGRIRSILVASLIVGLLGLIVSELLGDRLSLLLIVQAQPWRALWMMAVLAAVMFALCGTELWSRGPAFRLAFVMLVLGWCLIGQVPAGAFAAAALVLYIFACRETFDVRENVVWAVGLAAGALVLVTDIREVADYFATIAAAPAGVFWSFSLFWNLHVLSMPVAVLAIVWSCAGISRVNPAVAFGVTALLLLGVYLVWDDRSPFQKLIDAQGPPADLNAIIATQQGSIVWIDGIEETTFWLHRPNYYSAFQGTGAIFSRTLAIEWQRRKDEMIALGLAPPHDRALPGEVITRPLPEVTRERVEGLCRQTDSLAWIIAPVLSGSADPKDVITAEWTPPLPLYKIILDENGPHWHKIMKYALINCAKNLEHAR